MEGNMNGYSLADIGAMMKDGNGLGGDSLILILLFLLIFSGGAFGNRGDYGNFASSASQQEILFGQKFGNLDNKLDRLGNGIADATYAITNNITSEGRGLQTQLANGFCTTQTAIHEEAEKTRALLQQNKIETLQGQINQLQLNAALCGVVRYPNSMSFNAGPSPFCNCGNNYGCCGNI